MIPKFCTTLWTLAACPSTPSTKTFEHRLEMMAAAGFDGIHDSLDPQQIAAARQFGLSVIGRIDGRFEDSWRDGLAAQIDAGVTLFNTHLGLHDTTVETAARRAVEIHAYATAHGARVQTETHRDTATETPEKYDALRARFSILTGEPLPTTWDFSHFAVMKHLAPEDYTVRLLSPWTAEIQASQLLHCRPFNGHHAQIPVTAADDTLTPEFRTWLDFTADLFRCWRAGPTPRPPLWICPEMGSTLGYHLSTHPAPWPEAVRCRQELLKTWNAST